MREQGWRTTSPERVRAVSANPPDWLVVARSRRAKKVAARQRRRDRKRIAARLGIQERAVKEHGIEAVQVDGLLASVPDWLIGEQERRATQIEREAENALRRALSDALVLSVQEAWFQELKHAVSDEEAAAIDARWAPEIKRTKHEARELVDELTPEQVEARITREATALDAAAVYRARQLGRRAFGGEHG